MSKDFALWYENNYHRLTGSGVWLRGGEINTVSSDLFGNGSLDVLICRLSTSWDVSDSYTHKILYEIITGIDGVYADMSFLPPPRDGVIFSEDKVPWLLGTSSKKSGCAFDVIAFSNSIVQELVNIPAFLQKSDIPIGKKERCAGEDIPLVILGGANALFTSALMSDNPVVDGIFTGESAGAIRELFRIIDDSKKQGYSKVETLHKMESVAGFFQPDQYTITHKRSPKVLEKENLPAHPPLMNESDHPGRAQIPISEGCPCFCSFCAESWSRKPYREYSQEDIRKSALSMKASLGANAIELYSFNYSMHSSFYSILQDMVTLFSTVKVSSQRFDHIAEDQMLLQYLHAIGKSTFTCGLEGISERLRRYLHKSLDEHKLRSSLSILLRSPIRELKIFLIATGKENDEDFDEFREFLTNLKEMMQSAGRKPRIIFSMTPLVRFPFTPLECENAPEPGVYHEIILQVERLVRCRGMEFRISADKNDYLLSQILVRAQDQGVFKACIDACRDFSFVYYREVPDLFIKELMKAISRYNLTLKDVLRGFNRSEQKGIPVQTEVTQSFLERSADLTKLYDDKGYCLGTYSSAAQCRMCGSCEDQETRGRMTSQRERKAPSIDSFRKYIKDTRQQLYQCNLLVDVNHRMRGIKRDVLGAAIARAFMKFSQPLVKYYKNYNGSYIEQAYGNCWVTGDDIITCSFSREAKSCIIGNDTLLSDVNRELMGWCTIKSMITDILPEFCTLVFDSPFKADPAVYCVKKQLKYTLFNDGDGSYRFEFTPQALKKNILQKMSMISNGDKSQVILQTGTGVKFELEQFLIDSFMLPSVECSVRINLTTRMSFKNA